MNNIEVVLNMPQGEVTWMLLDQVAAALGYSKSGESNISLWHGWSNHDPLDEKRYGFKTLAGAKRSTRGWWDDGTQYFVVYVTGTGDYSGERDTYVYVASPLTGDN